MNDYDFDSSGFVFTEALRDVEAEQRAEHLIRGKLAAAGFWPYLAEAASEVDFGHRLALVEDRLAQLVPPAVLEPVQASLAADWKLLYTARLEKRRTAAQERGERIREHTAQAAATQIQPDQEFFDQKSGSWVTAANSASGYTLPSRYKLPEDLRGNQHATEGYRDARYHAANDYDWRLADGDSFTLQHQDYQRGYSRAHDDLKAGSRHGKQAYLDPSDAQRYSAYPDLNPPVDNGPQHGPDGFVTDPQPDNSGASNAVIEQRQLTPGQWTVTPGTEWPVRPNAGDPTQVPRTASRPEWSGQGEERIFASAGASLGIQVLPGESIEQYGIRVRAMLVRQAGEGIVPTPGPNPNYFSQGSNGLAGPPSFPENPSGEIEPKTDNRMDDLYGAVPPQVSPGSAQGQADGQGYSRQVPGSSATASRRPFDRTAVGNVDSQGWFTTRRAGYPKAETDCGHKYFDNTGRCKDCGYSAADEQNHEGWVRDTFGDKGAERADALLGDNHIGPTRYSSRTAGFDDSHVTHYVGWARSQGKNPDDVETLKTYEKQSGIGRTHTNFLADQLYIGGGDSDWRRQGKTAGQFGGTEPTFRPGDRIQSFRGEDATVHRVIPSREPGKSHRVQVRWDDPQRNLTWDGREHPEGAGDERAYYESVFSHHPDTVAGIGELVDRAVPHSRDIQQAYSSKQAGTDGRIVGHCDHCRNPVRYHTNENGVDELRHLHNNDNRCSNGQQATAKLNRVHAFYDPADPGVIVVTADETRNRPTLDHPAGVPDEFDANTWDNALTQRPLQSAEDRHINTPTQARDPIPTIESTPRDNDLDENRNQNPMARETSLHEIMEMS